MKFKWLLSACCMTLLFAVAPLRVSSSPSSAELKPALQSNVSRSNVVLAFSSTAEEVVSRPPEQRVLDVLQDQQSGLLSIRARNVSMRKVMERISEVTGLIVKSSNQDFLEEPVEINLRHLPLKQIIDRLLHDVNSIFIYSSEPATGNATAAPDLVKVMLLSRKDGMPTGIITNQKDEPEKTESGKTKVQAVMSTELGRAILGNNTLATKNILRKLMETGTKKEIEQAIEALGNILLLPSLYNQASNGHVFYEALAALKEVDPQSGENFLTNLLETGEEAWVQSLAATNLGEFGREGAIDPLISAFTSNDPLVRDAAAHSLAKIGNAKGINQLLHAIENGDSALQQVIVNALAFAGDENSKAALKQAIAENRIPAEAVSEDVIYQLAQQNEPTNSLEN